MARFPGGPPALRPRRGPSRAEIIMYIVIIIMYMLIIIMYIVIIVIIMMITMYIMIIIMYVIRATGEVLP